MIYLLGSSDYVRITNWYTIAENQIGEIHTDSLDVLYVSQIQQLVDVMTPLGIPAWA